MKRFTLFYITMEELESGQRIYKNYGNFVNGKISLCQSPIKSYGWAAVLRKTKYFLIKSVYLAFENVLSSYQLHIGFVKCIVSIVIKFPTLSHHYIFFVINTRDCRTCDINHNNCNIINAITLFIHHELDFMLCMCIK